ncbi:hypothetical protein LIA77_00697 [Sarocladium implicatum]|nr:hypothetical protein LIA77_00697 [Sarocladium implicatum]
MKFLTLAAVALSSIGGAAAQNEDIKKINICNPLMYADGHVYKSNDRTMKGFPAQKAFPVGLFFDNWGANTAERARLVREDEDSTYDNVKLTRFEDSITIPFSGSGPVTFTHPSNLASGEVNKYWSNDYGAIDFAENADRAGQPRGGGFIWQKVDGYELEQLFWDRATYDRSLADSNLQWGHLDVLCYGVATNAWKGQLTDKASP